jgi:hypothetical protein
MKKSDLQNITTELTEKIIALQDESGCWNVIKEGDNYYPALKHYVKTYNTTIWALIFLADIQCKPILTELEKPLQIASDHLFYEKEGIFSLGKTHYPPPCLNGNMLYLLSYFGRHDDPRIISVIDFFSEYQRFDDGGITIPSTFPYRKKQKLLRLTHLLLGGYQTVEGTLIHSKIKTYSKR